MGIGYDHYSHFFSKADDVMERNLGLIVQKTLI